MANVNARKRGNKWQYYFEAPSIHGKRQRICKGGFSTKADALKAGREALHGFENSGITIQPSEMSVSDYLNYWLDNYCELNLKAATVESYRKRIKIHIEPKIGRYKLSAITPEILQSLISDLVVRKYSRNSILTIKGILSNSFNYAVHPLRYLASSPMSFVKIPKNTKTEQRTSPHVFIDKTHIDEIFERFAEGSSVYLSLLFGYRCGMRLGEAFAVTWDNVDLINKTVTIDKQLQWNETKSAWYITNPKYNSVRTIDIDEFTCMVLMRYKINQEKAQKYYEDLYMDIFCDADGFINEQGNGKVIQFVNVRENGSFIQPRCMQHASRVIHKTYPEFDFHSLRHTHCTMLLEAGLPIKYVQKRLGHKNIEVTMNIYNHLTENQASASKEKLDSIF